jgi:hypothetical protein
MRPIRRRRAAFAISLAAAWMAGIARQNRAARCGNISGSAWTTCAPTTHPGITTWPLGRLGGGGVEDELIHAGMDMLHGAPRRRAPPSPPVPAELRQPLDTLGLHWPVSLDDLKSRYKALAKRHHPDANGGDRGAEERLKTINLAYAAVRTHLVAEPVA